MPLLIHSTAPEAISEIESFVARLVERSPFALVLPVTAQAPAQNAANPNCDWLTLPSAAGALLQQRLLDVYAHWFRPAASLFWRQTAAHPTAAYGPAWFFDGCSWRGPEAVYSGPSADDRLLDALQVRLPAILTSDLEVGVDELRRALATRPAEVRVYLRGALNAHVAQDLHRAATEAPGRIHLFLRLEQGVARPRSCLELLRLKARRSPLRVTVHAQKPAADRACRAAFARANALEQARHEADRNASGAS